MPIDEDNLTQDFDDTSEEAPFRWRRTHVSGNSLHPDVVTLSWDEIRAISYGWRGGDPDAARSHFGLIDTSTTSSETR